jgi:hypothetical protein
MKLKRNLLLGSLFLGLTSLAIALPGTPLKYTAHEGDSHKFKMTADVEAAGQSVKVTGDEITKILKVDDAGNVTVQESEKNVTVEFNGQTLNPDDSPAVTRVIRPDGTTSEIRGDAGADSAVRRFTNLQTVKLPDAAPDKDTAWTWDVAADAKTGAVKQHSDFKIMGDEKVANIDCWKISVTTKELEGDSPGKVTGTVWISKADGLRVKMQGNVENLPVPGQPITMSGTLTMELTPGTADAK